MMNNFLKISLFTLSLLFLLAGLAGCQTNSSDKQLTNPLVGDVSYHQLITSYPYFQTSSSAAQEPTESSMKLKAISEATSLTVYFGVWCHDSVREIPQLMSLLDEVNNPNISYQLISLDRTKQEPQGRAKANDILYTPTIVVSQAGKELGRIIEKPEQDLATALTNILSTDSH